MQRRLSLPLALLVLLSTAPVIHAEPLALDAPAMRQLADVAIKSGFGQDALEILDALLLRDPADASALILKSRALRVLDRLPEAEQAARDAFAAAKGKCARFGASIVLAQALSLQDQRIAAQFWLRRAAEEAPNPGARALARRDFDLVRAATPLRLSFALSFTPSDNVNNGAHSTTFAFFDTGICPSGCPVPIPGESLALSGYEGVVGTALEYRVHDSLTAQGKASLSYTYSFVGLSKEAKTLAPTASASDFALTSFDMGYVERRHLPQSGATIRAGINAGRNWYSGEMLQDYVLGSLSYRAFLGPNLTSTSEVRVQRQFPADDVTPTADLADLSLTFSRRTKNGDLLSLDLVAGLTVSDLATKESTRQSVSFSSQKAAPLCGIGLSGEMTLSASDYNLSSFNPDGRHDRGLRGTLSARMNKIEFMGFAPIVSFEARRTGRISGFTTTNP